MVVGGGLIGTAIAAELGRRGLQVGLLVGDRSRAASAVAAGMLAPVTESTFTETTLLELNLAALDRWDRWATDLSERTGLPSGLHRMPTLSVASNADDAARLRDLAAWLHDRGLAADLQTSRQLRALEPMLSPSVRAGLLVASDWSVDNRRLQAALDADAEAAGVDRITGVAERLVLSEGADGGRVTGVITSTGVRLDATRVVLATGAWSGQFGLPFDLPVRPVKGQILRLQAPPGARLRHTVRAFTDGFEVYLVPREGGEVVVGASVEERGFDDTVTAGAVHDLLRDARRVVPGSSEYTLVECGVGWRPGTPDNAPILGRSPVEGLLLATGHHRNGVLLTPITAELIADLVVEDRLDALLEPHGLDRFGNR